MVRRVNLCRLLLRCMFAAVCMFSGSAAVLHALPSPPACENGIVRLPNGVNGQVTLCPAVAQQDPELPAQVAALQKAFGAQQTQMKEFARLIRDLNGVGGSLQQRQQTELLRNVLSRLGDLQTTAAIRLNDHAQGLSSELEGVAVQMGNALANPKTTTETAAALQGATGDAISRLDFKTATEQLEDISTKLNAIDNKVDAIHRETESTAKTLEAMRADQLRAAQQQEELKAKAKDQSERLRQAYLDDPQYFFSLSLSAHGARTEDPAWTVHAIIGAPSGKLEKPRLEMIFAGSKEPVQFGLTPSFDSVLGADAKLASVATTATVCFSAVDPRTSQRRRAVVNVEAEVHTVGHFASRVIYQPSSAVALRADDGEPCHLDAALVSSVPSLVALPASVPKFTNAVPGATDPAPGESSSAEQAYLLWRMHKYAEALPQLQKAALAGDTHSDMLLGDMYAQGQGLPVDVREAIRWWQRGADQGDVECMSLLGAAYTDTRDGMTPDYVKAAFWYKRAADAGDVRATAGLGLCYVNGQGAPHDPAQGARLLEKAAGQGDAFSMLMLARLYERGNGVPRNPQQATFWYKKAAALGEQDAIAALQRNGR